MTRAYPLVSRSVGGKAVSDSSATQKPHPSGSATIAEIIRDVEPMGDLSRFVIEDLTPEDEDEFFSILETA